MVVAWPKSFSYMKHKKKKSKIKLLGLFFYEVRVHNDVTREFYEEKFHSTTESYVVLVVEYDRKSLCVRIYFHKMTFTHKLLHVFSIL